MSRLSSVAQADAVLDDDVVEIRLDADQHLPDDLDWCEVRRVDGRGAARAAGEEQLLVPLLHVEPPGEPSRRPREGRLWQVAAGVHLPLRLRPQDRVDVRLDDAPRIGIER